MKRRNIVVLAVGAVAFAAALAWAFRPQPMPVEVADVQRATFELTVDEDGRTRVRQRYVIAAPLTGRLARVTLDPGDRVQAGKPVARIAPTAPALLDARTQRELLERVGAAEAQLAQAAAEVARAEAALAQSQTDLARQKKLEGDGFVSGAVREQAELAVRVQARALDAAQAGRHAAEHAVAQARAAVASVRGGNDRGGLPVTSPVDGQVLRVMQQSEGPVALGTPLMEVADVGDLEIVVDLLSTDAARIAAGARVHIDAAGIRLAGRVRRIEPSAFTKVSALGVEEQRVNVIIDPDPGSRQQPALRVGDGYRVDLRVVALSRPDAVLAPVSALFRVDSGSNAGQTGSEGWAVFVVADGRAQRRMVTVGARGPQQAVIDAGLQPGERVVVYPSDTLADGRAVSVLRGR